MHRYRDLAAMLRSLAGPAGGDAVELGRGTQTVVYRIELDGQPYAVKVLHGSPSERELTAFRREGTLLARLDHPGLPHIHEAGSVDGRPYLVMELVQGRSLADLLHEGRLDEIGAARLGADVAEALAVAHRVGLVHRDVKPDNIMILPSGQAKLIDFGLAARTGEDAADIAAGTFAYSAPEQTGALRRPVDGRSDLYALGVVLFEALCGQMPFQSRDTAELIHQHLTAPAPDVRSLRGEASPVIAAVVAKLLVKDPDDRYQSGEGLAADLRQIVAGSEFTVGAADRPAGAGSGPLLGRATEVAALAARWQRASAGAGGAVVLTGPPGSGKSRLAAELVELVRSSGHPVLTGAFSTDDPAPLAPLRAAIDRYLREPPAPAEVALDRFRAAAGNAVALLRTLSPTVAAVLPEAAGPTGAASQEEQFATAVGTLLAELARGSGGALVVLDNAHRIDGLSRRVLAQLAEHLAGVPLLLVLTAPDELDWQGAVLGALADLHLAVGPLDEPALRELAAAELGTRHVPAALVARLAAASDGNPFAALEYLRAVIDGGIVRPSWTGWVLDEERLDQLTLPEDVLGLILRRVDALGPAARSLLTVAAAIGNRFEPGLVATASTVDDSVVLAELAAATDLGLIESSGPGYVFLHERIRMALLGGLASADAQRLHQNIASALDTGAVAGARVYELARHYALGEPGRTPDRIYRTGFAAGRLALAEHAASDAIEYLRNAAAACDEAGIAPESAFHAAYGTAAIRVGALELAEQQLDLALAAERDVFRRAELWQLLAIARSSSWRGDAAIEAVHCGLAELGMRIPRSRLPLVAGSLLRFGAGAVLGLLPQHWRCARGARRERIRLTAALLETGGQSAALADNPLRLVVFSLRALYPANRLCDGPEYAAVLTGLAFLAGLLRRRRTSVRLVDRAKAAVTGSGDPRLVAKMHHLSSLIHDGTMSTGARSGSHLRESLTTHGRWLEIADYLVGLSSVGSIQLVRGYAAEAAGIAEHGIGGRSPVVHDSAPGSLLLTIRARAAALQGHGTEAVRYLATARELTAALTNRASELTLAMTRLHLAVEQGETGGELDEAIAAFTALRPRAKAMWAMTRPAWAYWAFGRIAQVIASGPVDRARRLADAAAAVTELGRAADGPMLRAYHQVALAALEQLRGDGDAALRRLARVEVMLAALDAPLLEYEVARVRARTLRTVGQPEAAHRQAGIALMHAQEHGWTGRARWVVHEFALDTGAGSAPSQRRSATSAASGLHQRRLEALHQVSIAASAVLDPAELARVVLDETVRLFAADRAFLFLVESDDTLVPYLGRTTDGTELAELTGYGSTLVERVHESRQALVVTGSEQGAALGSQSALVYGLRSIMVSPLLGKGRLLGVIYLDSRLVRGVFTDDDVELLSAITNHLAVALETARAAQLELAVQAARRDRDLAEKLRGAVARLSATLDPDEVVERLVAYIVDQLSLDRACVVFTDDAGKSTVAAVHGVGVPACGDIVSIEGGLSGERGPGWGGSAGDHSSARPPAVAALLGPGPGSWLHLPLSVRGAVHGILVGGAPGGHGFSEAEVEIAAALAAQGMVAYDNAKLFRAVQDLAVRDGLTGLFNRRYFFELGHRQLTDARRHGRSLAMIMVDIDHFKAINDTHGHAVGDAVIQEVARRLAVTVRESDMLCRYGGEEFAIALVDPVDGQAAAGERLRAAIGRAPVPTAAGQVPVTISVGVAALGPAHGTLEAILADADAALYEAKRAGRNRVVVAG